VVTRRQRADWQQRAEQVRALCDNPTIPLWQKAHRVGCIYQDVQLDGLKSKHRRRMFAELAKLNQLEAASLNAQNVYYGTQLNLEANHEATTRWLFDESREEFHVYTGQGGFTGLPPEWPYGCVGCN